MHWSYKQTNDFREDPAVKTGSAQLEDYRHSGFDRGHLVPAADMKWSEVAMSETFLLSNISPQNRSFNAGIWENLESTARKWAAKNEHIFIVTGPILQDSLFSIGENGVSVPQKFYKIILDLQPPVYKCIAFIIPNAHTQLDFWHYVVTVDEVESLTGLDFFPLLEDNLQDSLEMLMDTKAWR